jgi:hypothetical protein
VNVHLSKEQKKVLETELLFSWATMEEACSWLNMQKNEVMNLCNRGELRLAVMRRSCVVGIDSINRYIDKKEMGEKYDPDTGPRIVSIGKMLTKKRFPCFFGKKRARNGCLVVNIRRFFEANDETVNNFFQASKIKVHGYGLTAYVDRDELCTVLRRAGIISKIKK